MLRPRSEVADQLYLIMEARNDQAHWRWHAACKGMDPDIFFAPVGAHNTDARAICGRCQVRAECLRDLGKYEGGFLGGMTSTQRRKGGIVRVNLAQREMLAFIAATENDEIAALDLGIKPAALERRRFKRKESHESP